MALRGLQWHGDVFKVVFAIHDFFPNLSYRTIVDNGNPRLVVVRRQRQEFTPAFSDLEQITRMTYYDYMDKRCLMNLGSLDEVIAWLEE